MNTEDRNRENYLKTYRERHTKPYFNFVNLLPSERLDYEMLDGFNFVEIFNMFGNDPHRFILKEYKSMDKLKEYVACLLLRPSPFPDHKP